MDSVIWRPTFSTGFSVVNGSWKIMASWLPRRRRISRSDFRTRSSPMNRISPPTMRPGWLTSRMMDAAVMLLPQPDSPTTPTVSPGYSWKLTPSTALTTPRSVKKCVRRFRTSRIGSAFMVRSVSGSISSLPQARVQRVPQPFAQQVDAQHRQQNRDAGKGGQPPRAENVLPALGNHGAPRGLGRLHAQAEKAERRLHQNDPRDAQRGHHDDRRERVGQNFSPHNVPVPRAHRPGRLHVLDVFRGQNFPAH